MKTFRLICICLCCFGFIPVYAQNSVKGGNYLKAKTANDFPALMMTDIKGAPRLGKPTLITGDTGPIIAEGYGWAAPVYFDWDGDGKRDLLIGEFGSGAENLEHDNGNFIRVYLNHGTDSVPKFINDFQFAWMKFGEGVGGPMSVYTSCCIGFTPQLVDLNNDGFMDILSGQYDPGDITWFKGSQEGFYGGIKIIQAGIENRPPPRKNSDFTLPNTDSRSVWYWNYSAPAFGDIDGDGDYDMVVGGAGLRLSENIGTKEEPRFGERKLLLDTKGNPLKMCDTLSEIIKSYGEQNYNVGHSGSMNIAPVLVDWDNDGILDILATDAYSHHGSYAIVFFKGVKTSEGARFETGVPLFNVKGEGKAFPGAWLRLFVTDWNHDGINDLLIGTSVATLHGGKFDHELSWAWEEDTKILKKSPAHFNRESQNYIANQIASAPEKATDGNWSKQKFIESYYGKGNYKTLAHQGYVYLMLGSK